MPKIIQTVTGQGYRFIAPVTPLEEENRTETPSPEASTVPTNGQNIVSEPNGWLQTPGLRSVGEQQDQTAAKVPAAEIGQWTEELACPQVASCWSSVFARTGRCHNVHPHPEPPG